MKDHIFPTIPTEQLFYQYGFKPTGSITAALVDITSTVSIMLEDNKYVRCLLIDFSKAFDSVDHLVLINKFNLVLINKFKMYNIADNIIKWIVSFLTDRDQYTKLGDQRSFIRVINRPIVQGSGIGPTLFVIFIVCHFYL